MSHRLLNRYEEVTYDRLRKATSQHGAHVFAKVRVSDAIPINNSGVSTAEFSFALKSHLDFLVTDPDSHPLFAVEFDGPTHKANVQQQRDRQKDAIMERFSLPMLRINANYLNRKYRDYDLLTYFVEVWFLHDAFSKAQEDGQIPSDEIFDPAFILSDGQSKPSWPYWLSIETQAKIQQLFADGQVASPCPSYWAGIDPFNKYRCIIWILLPKGGCCYVETGMRTQLFPMDEIDILVQVATFDLFNQIQDVLQDRQNSYSSAGLDERILYYKAHFAMRGAGGAASPYSLPTPN